MAKCTTAFDDQISQVIVDFDFVNSLHVIGITISIRSHEFDNRVRRMPTFPHRQIVRLTCLTVCAICVFSGCRSGIFKKSETEWKRPDMSGLAFWKKGESKAVPPPPALHFDPAPASGDVRQANSQPARKTAVDPELQQQVDQMADAAKKAPAESASKATQLSADAKSKPIRTPYSLSGNANPTESNSPNRANSFDPKAPMPANTEVASSVEQAQADFNAVIGDKGKQPSSSLATTSKSLQPAGAALANDFQLPAKMAAAKNQVNSSKNNLDTKLSNVNRSLDDASGNLVANAKNALPETANKSLQPSFNSMATGANESLAATTKPAKQATNNFANNRPVGNENSAELQRVQAEVASAQQQIAELRAQIAATQRPVVPVAGSTPNQALNSASTGLNQPVARVAQLNSANSNGFAPSFTPSNSNKPTGNFSPLQPSPNNPTSDSGNVLRANSKLSNAGGSTGGNQVMFPIPSDAQPTGNYPSTPHSGYSSSSANLSSAGGASNGFPVQPVGLQAPIGQPNAGQQNVATVMHAQTGDAQQFGARTDAATNHVSEVAIPAAVLRGSGSYAPGSVNRLTPKQ